MKKKFKISKKELMDFFFEEVTWRQVPKLAFGWFLALIFLLSFLWVTTKIAIYFHL